MRVRICPRVRNMTFEPVLEKGCVMKAREAVLLVALSLCLGGWQLARSQGGATPSPIPLTRPESCREFGAIFQSGNLSCAACAPRSLPAPDGTTLSPPALKLPRRERERERERESVCACVSRSSCCMLLAP